MGPGTELKTLLRRFGIRERLGCQCGKYTLLMDQRGPDWCLQNLELIVDVMEREAECRGLPFLRSVGRALVKRSIRKSRRVMEWSGRTA